MRLCIADPPYLGRGERFYGVTDGPNQRAFNAHSRAVQRQASGWVSGDQHPDAGLWDDPRTHADLVDRLCAEFDGWAIAMAWDNLRTYMAFVPADVWIGVWLKTTKVPPGASRMHNVWEPVIARPPVGRRAHGTGPLVRSLISAPTPGDFIGAKPAAWTRWVLDMLGYDPDTDEVVDLFPGSGAVAAEVAQTVINFDPTVP